MFILCVSNNNAVKVNRMKLIDVTKYNMSDDCNNCKKNDSKPSVTWAYDLNYKVLMVIGKDGKILTVDEPIEITITTDDTEEIHNKLKHIVNYDPVIVSGTVHLDLKSKKRIAKDVL